jgi:hypothetical protein
MSGAGLALRRLELALACVAKAPVRLGPAGSDDLEIQGAAVGERHVGEGASVAIASAGLGVEDQHHALAAGEGSCEVARLRTEALAPTRAVRDLGRVHAHEAHAFAPHQQQRVAVDHTLDAGLARLRCCGFARVGCKRAGQEGHAREERVPGEALHPGRPPEPGFSA